MDKVLHFIEQNNCKKILLLTGKKSFEISGGKDFFSKIKESHNFIRFSDFTENPKFSDVKKGVEVFNTNQCDSIISIGGGSVIDMAKLISCMNKHDMEVNSFEELKEVKREVPFMAIPTTAGSGSEATTFAVVYFKGIKYSIEDESLLPDSVLLDPILSFNMPPYLKAVSGLDAFSQSIESYWSKKSTIESREYSNKALNLIWNNLYNSVVLNSFQAHEKVVLGANYAGKAINISKTTAPHALSYYFTGKHNIKHGHAVSLTLSKVYDYNESKVTGEDIHNKNVFSELNQILGIKEGNSILVINNFIKSLGVELNFSKLKIDIPKEFDEICLSINKQRLKNNPFEVNLKNILID